MALAKGIDKELVKMLYETGTSSCKIAYILGCGQGGILKHLQNMGVPRRSLSEARKVPGYQNSGNFTSDMFPHKTKQNGYVYIWVTEHPRMVKRKPGLSGGYVAEHVLIWEESNGEFLPKGWCIHHLNGIRDDNRPENLASMKAGEHIHQIVPYQKRIKELEDELSLLRK